MGGWDVPSFWEHDLGSPHATREALADAVAADIATHGPAGVIALAISHADCEDLADRIRHRLRVAGHVHGPELAGPGWGTGERCYAVGDRVLVHGTLRADGQRLHNGSVLTVTAVADAGLRAVTAGNAAVVLPRSFVQGHRGDGSPNLSHAWARTVDGIQGGTWPQVHLLGNAALVRYSGYTAQSRGRHATHTWNVNRLPGLDHGGVLADQRTPEREVLDALRRQPDTGFAIHDAPRRDIDRLRSERAELEALLQCRPVDRRPAFHQAERSLESAKKDLITARHRLQHAEQRLEELGPLSQLRRGGRHAKASTLEAIVRFAADITRAESKIVRYQSRLNELHPGLDEQMKWDAHHNWPQERLRAVESELADITRDGRGIERCDRDQSLRGPTLGGNHPWPRRLADRPPAPEVGHGIDLGL